MLASLRYPVIRTAPRARRAVLAFDIAFGVSSRCRHCLIASENAIMIAAFARSAGAGVAIIVIIGAIELTRRATGLIIPILIILALSYPAFWGQHLDNVFRFGGFGQDHRFRTIFTDSMFGTIANISATFVFLFILFGAFWSARRRRVHHRSARALQVNSSAGRAMWRVLFGPDGHDSGRPWPTPCRRA